MFWKLILYQTGHFFLHHILKLLISNNTTATFPSLFYKKLLILQPLQNRDFSERNCCNDFSLGKITNLWDKYWHKNQTKGNRDLKNGIAYFYPSFFHIKLMTCKSRLNSRPFRAVSEALLPFLVWAKRFLNLDKFGTFFQKMLKIKDKITENWEKLLKFLGKLLKNDFYNFFANILEGRPFKI